MVYVLHDAMVPTLSNKRGADPLKKGTSQSMPLKRPPNIKCVTDNLELTRLAFLCSTHNELSFRITPASSVFSRSGRAYITDALLSTLL